MADVLERIVATKRDDVAKRQAARPLASLERALPSQPCRPFKGALEAHVAARGLGLIAEIKKASPSKGLIRADFDPARLALAYAAGGASCLSVLTEVPNFQGDDAYLVAARAAVSLPVLRKDFLVDRWQLYESRLLGADCVLVILAAITDDGHARALVDEAQALGMGALVEVHDEAELERALALPSPLVGINNRNLKTLTIDLGTTERLAPRVTGDRLVICESGLDAHADLRRMTTAGARCFLVGESLMRQADVEAATQALLGGP